MQHCSNYLTLHFYIPNLFSRFPNSVLHGDVKICIWSVQQKWSFPVVLCLNKSRLHTFTFCFISIYVSPYVISYITFMDTTFIQIFITIYKNQITLTLIISLFFHWKLSKSFIFCAIAILWHVCIIYIMSNFT